LTADCRCSQASALRGARFLNLNPDPALNRNTERKVRVRLRIRVRGAGGFMVPRHARLEWRLSMNHPSQIRMTKPANAPLRVFRHSGFGFLSSFVIQRFVQVRFLVPMHANKERRLSMNHVAQQPSRLRVAAASRRRHEHRAGGPMHSQAKTPARTPALHPPGNSWANYMQITKGAAPTDCSNLGRCENWPNRPG